MAINEYRTTIAESDEGLKFLQAWDGVQLLLGVYGISRLIVEAPHIFRHLKRVYGEYRASRIAAKNPEIIHEINEKLKAIIDDPDVAKYLEEAEKRRLAGKTEGVSEIELDQPRGLESNRGEVKWYVPYAEEKFKRASEGAQNYIIRMGKTTNGILDLGPALENKEMMNLFQDMSDMHAVLNREFALVRKKKGGSYLLIAGDDPVAMGKPMVSKVTDMDDIEVIAHTHPSTDSILSANDFRQLEKRGQNWTYLIVSEKGVFEFRNIRRVGLDFDYDRSPQLKLKSLELKNE